jgi:hypothetical protein
MLAEEMRLDGNSAAGPLRDVFARDVTGATATCAGCGAARPVGALLAYGHAMGIVLRCPGCDAVMLRLTATPGWLRVELTGVRLLAIPDGGAAG